MNTITAWKRDTLIPAVYEQADSVFPWLSFKKTAQGWQSPLKLDGSQPSHPRHDKTVITKQLPGQILEQGGDSLGLVDYTMERLSLDFIGALEYLAQKTGLSLPRSDFDQAAYAKAQQAQSLLQQAASYMAWSLENAPTAQAHRQYLEQRGYSSELIQQAQLGYLPSFQQLKAYLESKGYSSEQITQELQANDSRIGTTHSLAIPWIANGQIKGFKFRAIDPQAQPKYLNTKGLDRSSDFFNLSPLKGQKDLVIVEGELDCLAAQQAGLPNVVALAGANITAQQIASATAKGARSFTLCFDSEKATPQKLQKAIAQLRDSGQQRIYVAPLPLEPGATKADPDSYIRANGAASFLQIIQEAIPFYDFQLEQILEPYQNEGHLTAKQIHELEEQLVETGSTLQPMDKDKFIGLALQSLEPLGITKPSLEQAIARIQQRKEYEQQTAQAKELLQQAQQSLQEGKTDKALQLLATRLPEVQQLEYASAFQELLKITSRQDIIQEEADSPDSLNSGFPFYKASDLKGLEPEYLELPGGALSIFAAPTNHGKTLVLINAVLNALQAHPDKSFVFFTYEEKGSAIIQYFLNTYLDLEFSNNRRRSIRSYYKTGSLDFIKWESHKAFQDGEATFFAQLIDTGRLRVQYVNYDSSKLAASIRFAQQNIPDLGGIFIDYFQLLHLPTEHAKSRASRQEELKQICLELKDLAVQTGLPIVLAAQFNREASAPHLLHPTRIGEAGDIERIANTIVGIYNLTKTMGIKKPTKGEEAEIMALTRGIWPGPDAPSALFMQLLKSRSLGTDYSTVLTLEGNKGRLTADTTTTTTKAGSPF